MSDLEPFDPTDAAKALRDELGRNPQNQKPFINLATFSSVALVVMCGVWLWAPRIVEVEVPKEIIKTVEVPKEIVRTVEVPKEVIVTREIIKESEQTKNLQDELRTVKAENSALKDALAKALVNKPEIIRSEEGAKLTASTTEPTNAEKRKRFDEHIQRADKKSDSDDYTGALAECDKAFELLPNAEILDAFLTRGRAKGGSGDYVGALRDFNKASTLRPNDEQRSLLLGWRGFTYLKMKDFTKAQTDFNESLALKENSWTYFQRARTKLALSDLPAALADAEKSLSLHPNDVDTRRETAFIFCETARQRLDKKDWRGGLKDIERSIALDPENPMAFAFCGWAKKELGDLKGALLSAEKSVTLANSKASDKFTLASAYLIRGDVKSQLKDWQGAELDYGTCISYESKHDGAYRCRSFVREKLGNKSGAEQDWKQYLAITGQKPTEK